MSAGLAGGLSSRGGRPRLVASVAIIAAWGLVVSLGVAAEPSAAQGLPKGDAPWIEVRTPHFTVVSNGREADAVAAAESLERFRFLLERLRQRGGDQPLPTLVFAFRNGATFRNYNPWPERDDVAGFFFAGRFRNNVALEVARSDDSRRAIYHEYVHQFVEESFPEVPLWFNEGLAEYYSSFEIERDEALVGRPLTAHLEWLQVYGSMPVAEMLAVSHDSPAYNESERAGGFYAQAWVTVHYLLSDPTRTAQVVRYLDAIGAGKDVDTAFREAFDRGYEALEEELERYVSSSRFTFLRVPFAGVEVSATASPLAKARALALLGEFVASFEPPRLEQAAAHFDAALALDPAEPLALAGRGLLLELAGDLEGAIAGYRRAATAAPGEPYPSLLLGVAGIGRLRQLGWTEVATPEQVRLARSSRAALERVLELSPGLGIAQEALGMTYLWDGDPRAGIEVLMAARRSSPSRSGTYVALAVLAARVDAFGDAWQAADALERVEAAKPAVLRQPELADIARLSVAQLQLRRAGRAVNAGEEQAALDLVAALDQRLEQLAASKTVDVRPLVEHIAQLRAHVRRNQAARALQEAADRARAGELEPALAAAERILAEGIDDDDLRGRAEELRRAILRALGREPR